MVVKQELLSLDKEKKNQISIKGIEFDKNYILIELEDKRIISFPLKSYPSINKLKPSERKKITITSFDENMNMFTFDNCSEMFILDESLNLIVD